MKTVQKVSVLELFYILLAFFLANVTALFNILWLLPAVVLTKTILMVAFGGIALWILYQSKCIDQLVPQLRRNWFLFPFEIFAFFSIFWSVQPEISTYRWIIFVFIMIIGAYLGIRFSLKELLTLLSSIGLLVMLLSSLMVALYPRFGIMNYHSIQGAWMGIFWHKNHMGIITSFFNMIFLFKAIESFQSSKKNTVFWGLAYLYTLFFLFKTDSVGAYLSTIFVHGVLLVLWFWMKIRKSLKKKHYVIFAVIILLVVILLVLNLDAFFGLFNRQTNLTGRIPMWNYLFSAYISKRPVLGYGFNAFWYVWEHEVDIQSVAGYPDPILISDNGFIDILVNTGIIGLGLFLLIYLGMWYRSFQVLKNGHSTVDLMPITIMAFSFIGNLSWSLLFENESFLMLVLLALLFSNSKATAPQAMEELPGPTAA